jgi:hypothetical protein
MPASTVVAIFTTNFGVRAKREGEVKTLLDSSAAPNF